MIADRAVVFTSRAGRFKTIVPIDMPGRLIFSRARPRFRACRSGSPPAHGLRRGTGPRRGSGGRFGTPCRFGSFRGSGVMGELRPPDAWPDTTFKNAFRFRLFGQKSPSAHQRNISLIMLHSPP